MLTADAVISFGFYHFACILLLTYMPDPKFANRNAVSLSETNVSTFRTFTLLSLMCLAKNPGACSPYMRRMQMFSGDWATFHYCLPHNIHLGTACIGSKRAGWNITNPRRLSTESLLAHYLDHERP